MEFAIGIVLVVVSIILHEVAHGFVADLLGDPTARYAGRLTLNPIPHIDPVGSVLVPGLLALSSSPFLLGWAKPVPYNPYNVRWGRWGEALVAAAGPATNILIAAAAAMLIRFEVVSFADSVAFSVLITLIFTNLSLAILNLIPFPPLDGSKIVAALLPYQLERQYRSLETLTYALGPFGLLIVLIGVFYLLSPGISAIARTGFSLLTGIPI